ncbi:unnamed protein product, partial [Ectocarpus fasciculatus]
GNGGHGGGGGGRGRGRGLGNCSGSIIDRGNGVGGDGGGGGADGADIDDGMGLASQNNPPVTSHNQCATATARRVLADANHVHVDTQTAWIAVPGAFCIGVPGCLSVSRDSVPTSAW